MVFCGFQERGRGMFLCHCGVVGVASFVLAELECNHNGERDHPCGEK